MGGGEGDGQKNFPGMTQCRYVIAVIAIVGDVKRTRYTAFVYGNNFFSPENSNIRILFAVPHASFLPLLSSPSPPLPSRSFPLDGRTRISFQTRENPLPPPLRLSPLLSIFFQVRKFAPATEEPLCDDQTEKEKEE